MAGQRSRPSSSVDFTNLAEWRRGFEQAIGRLRLSTEDDLVRLGLEVQNRARNYCPVDTGRLRSSIQSSGLTRDAKGAYVEIGTNVEYAAPVEFGTDRAPAQPYLRPALLEAAQEFR